MESQVLQLLQQAAGVLFSVKEVSKKIDRDRFREEPNWARPFLKALAEQGQIAEDNSGYFYYPKEDDRRR